MHPITGEGIAYALWSAELLADALLRNDPESYQDLWQEEYGAGLAAASGMLSSLGSGKGTYEAVLQLSMTWALSGLGQ